MKKVFEKIFILLLVFGIWTNGIAQIESKFVSGGKSNSFGNVEGITAAQMKNYLTFIASDELEGRDTPSRGLYIAAMFIASHLTSWGVKLAGNGGTYFQRIPLIKTKINPARTRVKLNGQTFAYGDDFLTLYEGGSAEGNLVFSGNGWFIKSKNIDPFQRLNIKDKIVVITDVLPKGINFEDLTGKEGKDWADPLAYAQANGAKAVVSLPSINRLSNWQARCRTQMEKGSVSKGWLNNVSAIPFITASPRLITTLFQGEKINSATILQRAWSNDLVESFELKPEKKLTITVSVESQSVSTQNVVGVLEGSDPILKNEYVALGAHYDHDGVSDAVNGDAFYNGADDDGSGTVAVMAIAEALSKGIRPKRSILFVWHTGEEKGLWGSKYFTSNPTIPLQSVVAQLNIDMIGRSRKQGDANSKNAELAGKNEIYVIGSRIMSSELGNLSETINRSFLNLNFNYKYDDLKEPNRFLFRSDHFQYAKKGIPILFYFNGVHADYHQPSDSVEKIDFANMEKVTRTIFATAWELANRPDRPKMDKKLPEAVSQ